VAEPHELVWATIHGRVLAVPIEEIERLDASWQANLRPSTEQEIVQHEIMTLMAAPVVENLYFYLKDAALDD